MERKHDTHVQEKGKMKSVRRLRQRMWDIGLVLLLTPLIIPDIGVKNLLEQGHLFTRIHSGAVYDIK